MTMGISGFKHKKDLMAAVGQDISLKVIETSFFGKEFRPTGTNVFVGPSPEQRRWYAEVETANGIILKVR